MWKDTLLSHPLFVDAHGVLLKADKGRRRESRAAPKASLNVAPS